MGFLSFKFILFLSVTFFMYFVVPKRFQWIVLLLFSYAYYYLNSHKLVLLLIAESIFVYFAGLVIDRFNNQIKEGIIDKKKLVLRRKVFLVLSIIVVLSLLVIFKYLDFVITNINYVINGNISLFNFILPLGISFYTLQAISYLVDVSKGKFEAEKNVLHFMLYMSYFPQIIQGPIPRYNRLAPQLFVQHDYDYDRVFRVLQLMFWGIAKKVIIADRLATPVSYIFENYSSFKGFMILFGAICYSIQIYADFSGGIDAIKGISEVFGIYLDDNFHQPYFSKSIEEFWRRWHISLGSWMKDYVFYPLSLSKSFNLISKKARKLFGDIGKRIGPCIAMFIVYLLVGLWHGPNWKYVAYGIWNGLFIMSGILFENQYKNLLSLLHINSDSKLFNIFRMIRTFLICSIGRLFSRADTLIGALAMFKLMFTKFFDVSYLNRELLASLGLDLPNWILVFVGFILILYIDYLKEKKIDIRKEIASKNIIIRWVIYYILIMSILVFGLYGGAYDGSSFIYGRF